MNIPVHIGIIMDGNGRWAKKRFMPRQVGHRQGGENLRKLAYEVEKLGVKYLTVYAFSTENWKRPEEEVSFLIGLLREKIQEYIDDKDKNNMRINCIGDLTCLDKKTQADIEHLKQITKNKTGLQVNIAFNYGGRGELIRAVKKMYNDLLKTNLDVNNITEGILEKYLDTSGIPDPELIIRTSGEFRTSNFLLWQSAYSEYYITDKLWPDFNKDDLMEAIKKFNERERRFGGRK
ncbi:MAG: isoprenyl transferase [Clostridiales bacterium]|jgi:undecaprenyl diphosphate synthase|nr:isoprenyl transferase [Clostridiales bacterium]